MSFRKIEELDQALEYERLRREKLEVELDECRTEIMRLINTLRGFEEKKSQSRVRVFSLSLSFSLSIDSSRLDHQVEIVLQKFANLRHPVV